MMSCVGLSNTKVPPHQAGWVLMELVLCLLLFALVMWLIMRQNDTGWSILQVSKSQRMQSDHHHKAQLMQQLTGHDYVLLMDTMLPSQRADYPHCSICSGERLRLWFKATLQSDVEPVVEGK